MRLLRLLLLIPLLVACGGGSDSCPDFVSITNGTFNRTGTTVTWTLTVESIGELTFNRAPANVLEYRWGVELDANRDGNEELRVVATHFTMAGAAPVTTADILGQTQEDLWQVGAGGAIVVGNVTATLAGNTFTFTTTDAEDPGLAAITALDQSTFVAGYFVSTDDYCDESFKP